MWSYADMWESSSSSHPRQLKIFHAPPPLHVSSPLSKAHADMRDMRLFFQPRQYFFLLLSKKKKKGKPAGRVVVANLVGAWEKKHVGIAYTNGLHECARARQNIEYELLLKHTDDTGWMHLYINNHYYLLILINCISCIDLIITGINKNIVCENWQHLLNIVFYNVR